MLGETHGQLSTLPRERAADLEGQQMSDLERPMGQLEFGLEPVIEFVTGLPVAFQVDFVSTDTDLSFRWTIDIHGSPRHPLQRQQFEPSAVAGKSKWVRHLIVG
jgi:hypothetical protein